MPCLVDFPVRPAFFLNGNRGGMDLGERGGSGGKGEMRAVVGGETEIRM